MYFPLSPAFRCGLKSEERVAVQVASRYTVNVYMMQLSKVYFFPKKSETNFQRLITFWVLWVRIQFKYMLNTDIRYFRSYIFLALYAPKRHILLIANKFKILKNWWKLAKVYFDLLCLLCVHHEKNFHKKSDI